ncbi:hypothetical protein BO71DRAFT_429985 [Aspergillus ellipticus CBS 707.79]|uniref:Uncharacterized protein n=1 Tax=Aspergillus ellipticus CBS 707.79 TaxID=1448320 RepID=A0A319DT88_9EURO|nr:hypothetical protein BO71DRAFT_429985 [Aspergillus ellipticus CBS 707.79]
MTTDDDETNDEGVLKGGVDAEDGDGKPDEEVTTLGLDFAEEEGMTEGFTDEEGVGKEKCGILVDDMAIIAEELEEAIKDGTPKEDNGIAEGAALLKDTRWEPDTEEDEAKMETLAEELAVTVEDDTAGERTVNGAGVEVGIITKDEDGVDAGTIIVEV